MNERESLAHPRSACPNCGSTEWTLRIGLGKPRPDGSLLDVCNVCSPARVVPIPWPTRLWRYLAADLSVAMPRCFWWLIWADVTITGLSALVRWVPR